MGSTQPIKQLIETHFGHLSKKQQAIATFVLNNPSFIGTNAASEVGAKTGTSETTVIRFCYALGLEGYSHLQKKIRFYLFHETSSVSSLGNYIASKEELIDDKELIKKTAHKDITRIDRIAKQIDMGMFREATKKLHEAKKIYITGAGASKFAAEWLHFTLNILRPHVSLIPIETPELIRTMQEIDNQSVVVVISQHRYMKEPIQIAEVLYHQGVDVLAITDSNVAPIHKFSSLTFVLEQVEKSTIDLMPALISFLNSLITGMMAFDPEYYQTQRVNFDDVNHRFITDKWS